MSQQHADSPNAAVNPETLEICYSQYASYLEVPQPSSPPVMLCTPPSPANY